MREENNDREDDSEDRWVRVETMVGKEMRETHYCRAGKGIRKKVVEVDLLVKERI